MNHETSKHDGDFAPLSLGKVHFKIEGAGTPLLMMHGATVGLWEFEPILPYLHQQGFQTIRFDLYGHGISGRPACRFTTALFVQQISELLEYLALSPTVLCLGHSMGAAILASAISQGTLNPKQVALIAPLLCHEQRIRLRQLLITPVLGHLVMQILGRSILSPRRCHRLKAAGRQELISSYKQQVALAGYWRSLRALIRDGALSDQSAHYRALSRDASPDILLLWGTSDSVITAADIAGIRALLPDHAYRQLPGMAHNLLLTHPDVVSRELIDFLK